MVVAPPLPRTMQVSLQCQECGCTIQRDSDSSIASVACPKCGSRMDLPAAGGYPAGTVIRGFRIERRIGQGAMGVVYLATQLAMNRKVALKILPLEITADPHLVHRFLREVEMLAKVDHPNIVTAFDAGQEQGAYYLAMTYVDGEDLEKRMKRVGKLPEREALDIIRKVAEALKYAWEEHRILHNDVKPGNIIIDTRGHVKLMDLGLSKSVFEDTGMSMTGKTFGTPNYMSPEQAQGSKNLDTRSDQYALGATLYRLVTGVLPHSGTSVVELLTKKLFQPIPPARNHNPDVTDACEHLLEVLMARDPVHRYEKWDDLIADIDRVMEKKPPAAKRPGAGESAIGLEFTSPAQPAEAAPKTTVMKIAPKQGGPAANYPTLPMSETQHIEPEPSVPRNVWILGIAAMLIVAAIGAWMLLAGKQGDTPKEERRPEPAAQAESTVATPTPEPDVAPEPVPGSEFAWADDFNAAGDAFDSGNWQLLGAPVREDGMAILTGPEMEWGAQGILGTRRDRISATTLGGVEARLKLARSEVLARDNAFENAGYFDLMLSPDASKTAYVADTPLALVRILVMADGGYAYQVGAKKNSARANTDPIWLEKQTPLPDAKPGTGLEIALVVLPENVHITISQDGRVLHRRLHWVAFPASFAGQGVVPQLYVANQGRGRVRAAVDEFQIRPVDTTYLLQNR
jgi:uncharacterized ferredoxin-like protein